MKPYYSLSEYYEKLFGEKVYKIALNANLTCPNRDGTIDHRGCIFCSEGSGDFASNPSLSILEQIESGKSLISNKFKGNKYIAYFQAFTNTYGDINYLEKIYYEAFNHPDIAAISIATRPDCLEKDVINLLASLNQKKKVWVELGLQTIHEKTSTLIRRGYDLPCFYKAVSALNDAGLDIVVHLILGLPGESKDDILESVKYVCALPIQGIKLQLLHILKNTDLETLYNLHPFKVLSLNEYVDLVIDCLEHIPPHIVIHRLTGDGNKSLLIEPLWSKDKKKVLGTLQKRIQERESYQGKALK